MTRFIPAAFYKTGALAGALLMVLTLAPAVLRQPASASRMARTMEPKPPKPDDDDKRPKPKPKRDVAGPADGAAVGA